MEPSCLPGGGTYLGAASDYGQSGFVGVILQGGYSFCPFKGKLVSLRECLRKQREKPSLGLMKAVAFFHSSWHNADI